MYEYEFDGIPLEWVTSPPRKASMRGADAYPHEALAAVARWYHNDWLAVPDLPGHYVDDVIWGKLEAYTPVGHFDAAARAGMLYVRHVGPPDVPVLRSSVPLPPVRVAVLGPDGLPPKPPPVQAASLRRMAERLRARPLQWAKLPVGVCASPNVISDAHRSVFAPRGSYEAVIRGMHVYARYMGDDYARQLREFFLGDGQSGQEVGVGPGTAATSTGE